MVAKEVYCNNMYTSLRQEPSTLTFSNVYLGIAALLCLQILSLLQVLMELSLTLGTWRGEGEAEEREDTRTNVTSDTSHELPPLRHLLFVKMFVDHNIHWTAPQFS